MKQCAVLFGITVFLLATVPASATGLFTCKSSPEEHRISKEQLEEQLTGEGWEVRFIKEDGGCREVYAINPDGNRVEAYFHSLTLEDVFTSRRR